MALDYNDYRNCTFRLVYTANVKEEIVLDTHKSLSNKVFELQFENCTLDASLFTHEAHLRLAWIHINQYGIDTAIANITSQLVNFVNHLGAIDKYNETLTVAAVKIVYHFMLKSTSKTFTDFIEEFPRLKTHFKTLLYSHYSEAQLKKEAARNIFLEPDLLPFD